jgi:hypothetical protein
MMRTEAVILQSPRLSQRGRIIKATRKISQMVNPVINNVSSGEVEVKPKKVRKKDAVSANEAINATYVASSSSSSTDTVPSVVTIKEPPVVVDPSVAIKRKLISEYMDYGIRPAFYTAEDLALFSKVLEYGTTVHSRVTYDESSLHTLIPYFNVRPIQDNQGLWESDSYGFMRLNLTAFMVRANIANVTSCHAVKHNAANSMGQLGYLCNPSWAGLIVYKNDKGAGFAHAINAVKVEELNIPNPLASTNICFGYTLGEDKRAYPTIAFSRVYGSTNDFQNAFPRVAVYLASQFGVRVAVIDRWISNYRLTKKITKGTFFTMPHTPQITHTGGTCMPARYSDIDPCMVTGDRIFENHPVTIVDPSEISAPMLALKKMSGSGRLGAPCNLTVPTIKPSNYTVSYPGNQ